MWRKLNDKSFSIVGFQTGRSAIEKQVNDQISIYMLGTIN